MVHARARYDYSINEATQKQTRRMGRDGILIPPTRVFAWTPRVCGHSIGDQDGLFHDRRSRSPKRGMPAITLPDLCEVGSIGLHED
jgi:hypothetical protein